MRLLAKKGWSVASHAGNAPAIRPVLHAFAAVAALLLSGCTLEQVQIGQWYVFHTPRAGACPELDWRFVADVHRNFGGFVLHGLDRVATLSGTVSQDDTYRMTAIQVGGNLKGTITGRFTAAFVTLAIDGPGTPCDKQTFRFREVYYSGGGGGG